MRVGDLVRIIYKHGAINSLTGVYLGETKIQHSMWVEILMDGDIQKLYKFDYIFEVINESR